MCRLFIFFLDASRMSWMTKASKTLGLLESRRLRLQFPFRWLSALWESESLSLGFKWLELNHHSCLQLLMSNLLTCVRWWGFFPVKPSAWICSHLPLFLSGPCWISVRRLKIAWLYSHRHFSSFFIFCHFLHSFFTLPHPPPPNPSCGLALRNQGYHLSCHAHNNLNNRWMVNQWARTDLAADLDRSRLFARAITSSILRGWGSEMEASTKEESVYQMEKWTCSFIAVPLWRQSRL